MTVSGGKNCRIKRHSGLPKAAQWADCGPELPLIPTSSRPSKVVTSSLLHPYLSSCLLVPGGVWIWPESDVLVTQAEEGFFLHTQSLLFINLTWLGWHSRGHNFSGKWQTNGRKVVNIIEYKAWHLPRQLFHHKSLRLFGAFQLSLQSHLPP